MKPNATMTAMEGGDVTIRCAGLGTPTPTYAWFKVCVHFTKMCHKNEIIVG